MKNKANMKHIFLSLIVVLTLCGLKAPVYAQNQFFESLYDVPIMEGLVEMPEMAMSFDKPAGRISEAGAIATGLNAPDIYTFYDKALPQMGWQKKGRGLYIREGDELTLTIAEEGQKNKENQIDSLIVRFSLTPVE